MLISQRATSRHGSPTWFVIANGTEARVAVFRPFGGSNRTLWRVRLAATEDVGEHTSRAMGAQGKGADPIWLKEGVRRWDTARLCWHVARVLNEACHRREFGALVLIAPRRVLRTIREGLDRATVRCITNEIPKDLTGVQDSNLARSLATVAVL